MDLIWSAEDGAYLAQVPELPGCAADGATPEEAFQNLQVVVKEWIETAVEEGRSLPEPLTLEVIAQHAAAAQQQLQAQIAAVVQQTVEKILQNQPKGIAQNIPNVPSWRDGRFNFEAIPKDKTTINR
jgi:predicted RNase H-like HicB family nuclease